MPNRNYEKGVRFERWVMAEFKKRGFNCTRASGSHSEWDVIAYRIDQKPIFIQCKVTEDPTEAARKIKKFRAEVAPSFYYHKSLWVKVGRGSDSVQSVSV